MIVLKINALVCVELNHLVRKLDKWRRKKTKRGFRSKPREVSNPLQSQPPNYYAE